MKNKRRCFWGTCDNERVERCSVDFIDLEISRYCSKCGRHVYYWAYGNVEFEEFRWIKLWHIAKDIFTIKRKLNEEIPF